MDQKPFSLKTEGFVSFYRNEAVNCVRHEISRKVFFFFYHMNVMQVTSRDLRPETPKKSLSKNGSRLDSKLSNLIPTRQLTI